MNLLEIVCFFLLVVNFFFHKYYSCSTTVIRIITLLEIVLIFSHVLVNVLFYSFIRIMYLLEIVLFKFSSLYLYNNNIIYYR